MIVKENVTVYQCEFCKKKLFVKKAMERHIEWCTKNPENFKKCMGCVHLENEEIEYTRFGYLSDQDCKAKGFRCAKLNQLLYPLKVEKMGLPQKWPETFFDQEPMPKECEHFSYH